MKKKISALKIKMQKTSHLIKEKRPRIIKPCLQKIKKILSKIKISKILIFIFLTLTLVCLLLYNYINENFYNVTIEQLLFSVQMSEGTSNSVILEGTKYVLTRVLVIYLIMFIFVFLIIKFRKKRTYINVYIRNKKIKLSLMPFSNAFKVFICFVLLLGSVYYCANEFEVFAYLDNEESTEEGDFFKKNYVDGREVEIKSPEKKQNLIYIYVESLESSMVTEKNKGAFNKKLIPNLEKIASDNINFSDNNKIGGAYMPYGSSWTVAGMVGSTAGIPLKLSSIGGNEYSGYGEFLPGAYTLGDILEKNGYNNYLFIGSDADFGGRSDYFTYHGNYKILDYKYAKKQEWIDEDYYVWWGYEDGKLFDFAKDELKKIAKEDKPFNFTLLTTNTHFYDGYIEDSCEAPFDEKYLNAYYCSDEMIGNFLNWLKKQDFYEDTTIVITGDHLTMQSNITDMFDVKNPNKYNRTIYNAFINSTVETENAKNRVFTTYDFYPTVLAALGFEIQGNKLGLGTNLFSSLPTLAEEMGTDDLDDELKRKSKYYEKVFLNNLNIKLSSENDEENTASTASPATKQD